jgi:hypothetical protein
MTAARTNLIEAHAGIAQPPGCCSRCIDGLCCTRVVHVGLPSADPRIALGRDYCCYWALVEVCALPRRRSHLADVHQREWG